MPLFVDLEGVMGGELEGPLVGTVQQAMTSLKTSRIVSGAGDNGAWHVYVRDDDKYVCCFYRHFTKINEMTFTSKTQVRMWLREWLPRIQHQ
jgi:hypothetical protein